MTGRSHIAVGVCALEHLYVANELVNRAGISQLTALQQGLQDYLGLPVPSVKGMCIYMAAYLIGNLLPDIDNPDSTLGRFIHIPVGHRTWLHAIYLYLLVAVIGMDFPVFAWMVLGVVVHLFWDSFSVCGNCWFYKMLSDYRVYPDGAKIKKGHKLKLYRTGEWSEYLLVAIIVMVSVGSFIWIVG